jgi:hypothetical protein
VTAPDEARQQLAEIWTEIEPDVRAAAWKVYRTWGPNAESEDVIGEMVLMIFEKQERYLSEDRRRFLVLNLVQDANRLIGDQLVGRDGNGRRELPYGVTPEREDGEGNLTGVPLGAPVHQPGGQPEPEDAARVERVSQIKREFPLAWAYYAEGVKVQCRLACLSNAAMRVLSLVRTGLTSLMVAGASWRMPCWPGFLTR